MRGLLTTIAIAAVAVTLAVAPAAAGSDEDDQAIADEVVVEAGELVSEGWEEDPSAEDDAEEVEPPECEDLTQTVEDAEEGPFAAITYADPADAVGLTEVRAGAYIFGKAKAAKRFARALTSDDSIACQQTFGQLFGPDAQVNVEETEFNNAAGFRVTVEAEGDVFVVEGARARVGRGVVTVSAVSMNEPLPFVEDMALEEALGEEL